MISEQAGTTSFICGGDINIVKNNEMDIISGNKHDQHVVDKFNQFINELNFVDVWRNYNP